MVDYPIFNTKPTINPEGVKRYGVGYPFIHNVYDLVNEIDKDTKEIRGKRDKEGNPVFSFTYHYQKKTPL
ncbi:hypothetical protein LQX96_004655 [Salmonella enterica]|nr:hypothetical protein [Salmonella enterica]